MLTTSGRVGQSVLQTGDGVPRGTAKWTKRNHVAAVKVRASDECRADGRLLHGVHGSRLSWQLEVVAPISRSISGHPPPVPGPLLSAPIPKSPRSFGLLTRKSSSRLMVSPTTIYRSGRTPRLRRYTMYPPTTVECYVVPSALMERLLLLVLVMRTSSSGRYGKPSRARRVLRTPRMGWEGPKTPSGSDRGW